MKNSSKMLIVLGAGVVIGGVLGVLFAPDKGVETRHKIAKGGKKLKDKFGRKVKEGKNKLKEEMEKVNGELDEMLA